MASSVVLMSAAKAQTQTVVTDQQVRDINIEAGPLGDALIDLGDVYNVNILAPDSLVFGKAAPRITGSLSIEDALEQALAGSGLSSSVSPNGNFVISTQPEVFEPVRSARSNQDGALEQITAETIIVTGTKQNLSLQDTQSSVEAFTSERINREIAFDLDDLLIRTPNVSTNGTTNGVSIRGIARDGVGGAGSGVTSNVYADGAPLSNLNGLETLWDVQQVEILRGPQSTVQGRNALSGAVIITTNDPTYEFETAAQIRIGNLGMRQYSGVVSGPIIDGQLAARLSVDRQEFDGNLRQAATNTLEQKSDGLTLRGKLLLEPNILPALRVDLQTEYVDSKSGNTNIVGFPFGINDPRFAEFDPFGEVSFGVPTTQDTEILRTVARIDYALSDAINLVTIGTYEDVEQNRLNGDLIDPTQFSFNGEFPSTSETYSGEFRFEYERDRWSGWLGGYYFKDDIQSDASAAIALGTFFPVTPVNSVLTTTFSVNTQTENYAFFGEARFRANDRWTFEFGLRYDSESFDTQSVNQPGSVTPDSCTIADFVPGLGGQPCSVLGAPPPPGPAPSGDFSVWLPRGTIVYNFDSDRSVSFSVQRGYRAGGAFVRTTVDPQGVPVVGVDTFEPEFLTNYEFAFRSEWFDRRLVLNANVFYSDWEDQQVETPGPSQITGDIDIANVGSSELYGAEVLVNLRATDTLDLSLGLGLLETEFTDFPFAVDGSGLPINPDDPRFANLAGNAFPVSPDFTLTAGAFYEHPMGMFADISVNHRSGQFSDIENLDIDKTGSLTQMNLRGGYRTGGLEIYGFVENLFDERAITEARFGSVSPATGMVAFGDEPNAIINRPRIYGIGISLSY